MKTLLPRKRQRDTFMPWAQMLTDGLVVWAALHAVFWLRFSSGYFEGALGQGQPDYQVYQRSFLPIAVVTIFFLRFYGLYQLGKLWTFSQEMVRVFKAVFASVLILMAFTFFVRGFSYSRTYLVGAGLVLALAVSLSRYVLVLVVMGIDRLRGSLRNILVIGFDDSVKKLIHFYRKHPRFSARVSAVLDDGFSTGTALDDAVVLGSPKELAAILKTHKDIHEVVLAKQGLAPEAVLRIIYECEKELVTFRWISDLFGLIASKMTVSHVGGVGLLSFSDSPLADWENRFLKRSMDMILSAMALLSLAPAFLLLAVLVKLDSKGPVFYRQKRIGEDGRIFSLYKFRTMRPDAEETSGPVWARQNDPRRTRLGSFLREWNLDELPQLWNVFLGHMSLVGPRPERPFFVSQFREDIPRYMARHTIRSGLTGWAQVNGLRGNTSIEERTKFDLYYIENWSLLFDIKILFMTLFARNNAY